MEETRWKTSENNWKIDENCWKNNEKEGTQPRIPPKKMQKKNANLIPRPIYIYILCVYILYIRIFMQVRFSRDVNNRLQRQPMPGHVLRE